MIKIIGKMAMAALFFWLLCWVSPAFSGDAAKVAPEEAGAEKTVPQTNDDVCVTLKAPLMQPLFATYPIAVVNEEPIKLEEMKEALASAHEKKVEGKTKQSINFGEILKRLITAKLIIQEAKRMGLDELPAVKDSADAFARQTLRDRLLAEKTKGVTPDKAEVEAVYKELAREWKIQSVLFEKEDDAKKMLAEITGGKDFSVAADEAVQEKKAKDVEKGALMKPKTMQPQIAAVVAGMKAGSLSPIIKVEPKKDEVGYVLLKLLAIEYPENRELREQAEKEAGGRKRTQALNKFGQAVLKKNGKMDWKTINALDYNAPKPGMEKLLKDKRPVATIKGEKPITVAELTGAVKKRYFHGIEQAVAGKKANKDKLSVLYGLLENRLFRKEALRLGLDQREDYLKEVREYQESLLFGAFLQKAIVPDVKLSNEDIQAYYEEHKKDFSSPEMIRMRNLVFSKKEQAEDALEKLRKGADFNWLISNAEGQIDKSTEGLLSFEGSLLTLTSLPEGVRKAVAGAKPGDVRYYGSPEGQHYALLIQQVVPVNIESLDAVKGEIARKVYDRKLMELVEAWAKKLKESGEVKVYLMPASGV